MSKIFDTLRALSRINKHRAHQAAGTTTDRDLPDYDRTVQAIIDLGYSPGQARAAATRYFEAANETAAGPNPDYFINMVATVGLVEPKPPRHNTSTDS